MNNRKKIFFSSDFHIGHQNVLTLSNRPFRDLDHMHRVLVNNYNAVVPKDGICYFLGDMGLCKSSLIKDILNQLNGTKVLISGNHDSPTNSMYNKGFDVVLNSCSMIIAKELVTMSHFPLLDTFREDITGMVRAVDGDNWHGETKYRDRAVHNHGQFHLQGHIHSPNGGKSKRIEGRQMDVGIDANGFRPVSISQIESWIVKTKEKEILEMIRNKS